jgi:hypothetical protein
MPSTRSCISSGGLGASVGNNQACLDPEVLARKLNRLFGRFEVLDHLLTYNHRHSIEAHDVTQLTDLPFEVQEPRDVGQVPAATAVAVLG